MDTNTVLVNYDDDGGSVYGGGDNDKNTNNQHSCKRSNMTITKHTLTIDIISCNVCNRQCNIMSSIITDC